MSRQVVVKKRDDLDSSLEATETLSFTFEGIVYTTDLCADNAQRFQELLAPFMENAFQKEKLSKRMKATTKSGGEPKASVSEECRDRIKKWARSSGLGHLDAQQLLANDIRSAYYDATEDDEVLTPSLVEWREKQTRKLIREWARGRGYEVGDRRLSFEVIEAYNAAHGVGSDDNKTRESLNSEPAHFERRGGETAKSLAIPDPEERARVRQWAIEQGYVKEGQRGFLAREVQDAYYNEHKVAV